MIKKIHIQSQVGNRACLNDVDFSRDDVFSIEFTDMESAQAFAAKFPKYCKVLVRTAHVVGRDSEGNNVNYVAPKIMLDTTVKTDKRTGEANETAVKRVAKVRDILQTIMTA